MCLASKKGARQTKLTTALWYWQHCCWHHQSRGFVKTPLLVPTNNCNSTFLLRGTTPRDVTWQNFSHGKIISRKNSSSFKFPPRKEKKKLFLKLQLFLLTGDFMDVCWWWSGDPFSPHVAWLHSLAFTCIDKRQNSSNDRILGTLLQIFNWPRFYGPQKYPVPRHWIAFKPHFVQEPQKIFSSAFPLIYRAQWCYLRALRTFFDSFQQQRLQLKNSSMKILSQNFLR